MIPNQENTLSHSVERDCIKGDAQEPFHLLEDDEHRDNEQINCRESNSSMADNESEIEHDEPEACIPLYPEATLAMQKTFIGIMK